MVSWYVDEGLQRLDQEWKAAHPGAVVYHIGDINHSTDPDTSQHAPDDGGSKAGDDKGEVDASDFMPGKGGVTPDDLDDLAEQLRRSKDRRILYVIRRDRIFSSVVQPWVWRHYSGKYHDHTHVSVNDNFDNDKSDWHWEKLVARKEIPEVKVDGLTIPQLQYGDDDAMDEGYNHIKRAQLLANWLDNKTKDVDIDGVYGANTAAKFKVIFGGDGKKLSTAQWRKLHGI